MDYSTTVGETLVQAPTIAAARTALDTLLQLASAGDLSAVRVLGAILARKLGRSDAEAAIRSLEPLSGALQDERIPPLLRIYLLAFEPRELMAAPAAARELVHAAQSGSEFAAFKRLVRRRDVLQHEALKAYVLCAFIGVDAFSKSAGFDLTSGWQAVLDKILAGCRVVPGDSANTKFEIGRELILRSSASGLSSVLGHEMGHHVFDIAMSGGLAGTAVEALPSSADLLTISSALPDTIRKAAVAAEGDLAQQFLGSQANLLVSVPETRAGPYTHLSLTRRGAPLSLPHAAVWATLLLDLLCVEPSDTAVAYSLRGVFHFGFATPIDPDKIQGPADEHEAARRLEAIRTRSQTWLNELIGAKRIGESAESIAVRLGLNPPPVRFFPNVSQVWEDMDICRRLQLSGSSLRISVTDAPRVMSAAVRCAELQLVAALLSAGIKIDSGNDGLRSAGSSFGVVDAPNQPGKAHYGPTAETTFRLFRLLHEQGVDLDTALDERGTTLLLDSIRQEGAGIDLLLSLGADPNHSDVDGDTALHAAVGRSNPGLVGQLLRAGAAHGRRNARGLTPLALAVELDDFAAVEELLKEGADPESRDLKDATPLMSACSARVTRVLVAAGASPNAQDHTGRSALIAAAENGHVAVVETLLECGADADASDDPGFSALHCAAGLHGERARNCITALLNAGADIEADTNQGLTPLMIAARVGSTSAVEALLQKGANPNARSVSGDAALILAFDPSQQLSRNPARISNTEEVARLLVATGADLNAQNEEGVAALHLAATAFTSSLVRTLLELGAAVDVRTRTGETPLMWAVRQAHADMTKALLDAGADVNAQDAQGLTPLHIVIEGDGQAQMTNAPEIIEHLRARGAV